MNKVVKLDFPPNDLTKLEIRACLDSVFYFSFFTCANGVITGESCDVLLLILVLLFPDL